MSSNLPVAEMVAHLHKKIAYHKEQMEAHAKQEALHGREAGAARSRASEGDRAVRGSPGGLDGGGRAFDGRQAIGARPAPARKEIKSGGWHWIAELLERAIETKDPGEVFGATSLVDEILERWGSKLRGGIDVRSACRRGQAPDAPVEERNRVRT